MTATNERALRAACLVSSIVLLGLALALTFNVTAITRLWPWPEGALSFKFIGSTLGAGAFALGWIGAAREWGAFAGYLLRYDGDLFVCRETRRSWWAPDETAPVTEDS